MGAIQAHYYWCVYVTRTSLQTELQNADIHTGYFKNFSEFVVIHTDKGFSIVNEAEIDVFLESPCFLHDPMNVCNLISGAFAFSKSSLYIWKFSVYIQLRLSLKDFEHYLASM